MKQFLAKLWQGVPGNKPIVTMRNGVVKHHFFPDAESVKVPEAELSTCDVYFAPGGFSEHSRTTAVFQGAAAFWLDIDCGPKKDYPSQAEATEALAAWLVKRSFPAPSLVVSSGYGLHVYWLLKQAYSLDAWQRTARRLKQATTVDGFKTDPSRTSDAASILRLPGTINRKNGAQAPCEILLDTDTRYTLHDIENALPTLGPSGVVRPQVTLPDDEDETSYAPGDLEAVVAGCQQIRSAWGKADVPEPLWRAALSVLSRCGAGAQAIQAFSGGDPRYDAGETLRKAESTAGPLSCAQFESACAGGCNGCPNRGSVRSPIQIKPVPSSPKPLAAPPASKFPWPWSKIGRYTLTPQGIHAEPDPEEDADDVTPNKPISRNPVWVSNYRTAMRTADEKPYTEVEISYIASDGRRGTAVMEVGTMADKKKFEQEILHMSVTGVYNFPKLKTFLNAYMDQHVTEIGTEKGVRRMGWAPEGFVLGSRLITANGPQPAKVLAGAPMFKGFGPSGSLDGWKAALEAINKDEYLPLQATVLAGFGSAIYEKAVQQAAALILTGESGGGKTSAARAAIAIYGPPGDLMQDAKQSTYKGLALTLSAARNVPVLIDEIGPLLTGPNVGRFADLIYLAANGAGGNSATRDRSIREMSPWYLQPMFTSNISVLDLSAKDLIQAHRNRIIELPVFAAMSRDDGYAFHEAENNCGQACVPYLTRLVQMQDKIKEVFEATEARLVEKYRIPAPARFCSRSLAGAAMGGMIASELGLHPFDVDKVIDYFAEKCGFQTRAIQSTGDQITDLIPEWMRENAMHIIDIRNGAQLDLTSPIRAPKALLTKQAVLLSYADICNALRDQHISTAAFNKWCEKHKCEVVNKSLSANTPNVRVVVVPKGVIPFEV